MPEFLLKLNAEINAVVWGPYMLVALIGAGGFLTLRTRFIQFARFGLMCRETMGKTFRRGAPCERERAARRFGTSRYTGGLARRRIGVMLALGHVPRSAKNCRSISFSARLPAVFLKYASRRRASSRCRNAS